MAEVTAVLVKELREKTGAGMMDCKRALGETSGDLEAAVDWLRKKGLAAAAKKAGRVAAEGLVGVATRGPAGAVVEVNSETDFVARNDLFQAFVRTVAGLAVAGNGDVEALRQAEYPGTGRTVEAELTELVARIGENLVLRRSERLAVGRGLVASYVHNSLAAGLGKIGVLVALESEADGESLATLGRQLAMHVAAVNPLYLDTGSVPGSALDRERDVLREQARVSGKAEAIIERMVEGRLRKFYEEAVLLEQVFVVDGESRVAKVVETLGRQLAMHVAAANPQFLDTGSVSSSALDRERAVLREQAQGSGKSEAIVERMVEGRLRKFYEETVLLEQIFVIDGESRVSKVIEAAAKTAGKPIRVAGFARFALGEGVEKPPSDFATEVGAQLKS